MTRAPALPARPRRPPMERFRLPFCILLLAAASAAQVVYIENNNPTTGTVNTFPWAQVNGFTTLHVYYASQLAAGGVCVGAVLTDIAVAPATAGSGIYNCPQ